MAFCGCTGVERQVFVSAADDANPLPARTLNQSVRPKTGVTTRLVYGVSLCEFDW
jgi:hypothetical protein